MAEKDVLTQRIRGCFVSPKAGLMVVRRHGHDGMIRLLLFFFDHRSSLSFLSNTSGQNALSLTVLLCGLSLTLGSLV